MNVIVLAAGLGSRLRPHTIHRPKPLLHVGGDIMLGHVLRRLAGLEVDNLVLVVGYLGDQVIDYVRSHYAGRVAVVAQSQLLGQAHALRCAAEWLVGPVLVVFPDMVFDAGLDALASVDADGVVFAHAVTDPGRFGVVVTDSRDHAARFVEKPLEPVSDKAIVGVYYVKDRARLRRAIDRQLAEQEPDRGEYYLAGALQLLIDEGAQLAVWPVSLWADCGTKADLLSANRHLLERLDHGVPEHVVGGNVIRPPVSVSDSAVIEGSVIGPYVFVGPEAHIVRSVLGPHVSLAGGAQIRQSVVTDAVVEWGARIGNAAVGGILGRNTEVRGVGGLFDLADGERVVGAEGSASWRAGAPA